MIKILLERIKNLWAKLTAPEKPGKHYCEAIGDDCPIKQQLAFAIAELESYGECDTCRHQQLESSAECNRVDFWCEDCESVVCQCKHCKNGNKWQWHGGYN